MARKAKYNREAVEADWKTGKYSVRKLAVKHRISSGTVHNIVSGLDKTLEPLINAEVAIRQELATLNEHELNTFEQEVNERTRHIRLFNSATEKNITLLMDKVDADTSIYDHHTVQATILKGKETVLGKQPETAIQINNTNTPGGATNQATREEIKQTLLECGDMV